MRTANLLPLVVLVLAACTSETAAPNSPGSAGNNSGGDPPTSGSSGATPDGKPKPPDTGPVVPPDTDDTIDPLVDPNAVACTGAPGEIYEIVAKKLVVGTDIPLCRAKGRVLLIVNGASHCGFTPQYKPLQELYLKHKKTGFSILAFPSTSFEQEDTNEQQVSDFCTKENGITFPLFKIDIVADGKPTASDVRQPLYKWLNAQPGGTPLLNSKPVAWNFEKFLISKEGKAVGHWLGGSDPSIDGEIDKAIAAELAK
jgi:glutathione peroxidase-family protein